MQEAALRSGGELSSFDVVANAVTLQQIPDATVGLADTGARLVEATCRQGRGSPQNAHTDVISVITLHASHRMSGQINIADVDMCRISSCDRQKP